MASAAAATPAAPPAAAASTTATATTSSSSSTQHHHLHHAPAVPSLSSVLRRVIPWDTYVAAKLLEPGTDAAALRTADKLFATRRAVAAAASSAAASSSGPMSPSASSPSSASTPPNESVSREELAAAAALLSVLRGVTKEETVQYVLAVLDSEVAGSPRRARELFLSSSSASSSASNEGVVDGVDAVAALAAGVPSSSSSTSASSSATPDPVDLFLHALSRPDWFSVERASSLLAACFGGGDAPSSSVSSSSSSQQQQQRLKQQRSLFLEWCLSQLQRPTQPARAIPAAASALAKLLRGRDARAEAAAAGAPRALVPLLRRLTSTTATTTTTVASSSSSSSSSTFHVPATPQLAYDLCISLWQLSLTAKGAEAAVGGGAVPALADVLRSRAAAKEKVVRAAAQALKALVAGTPSPSSGAAAVEATENGGAASTTTTAAAASTSAAAAAAASPTAAAAGAAAVSCGLARICESLLLQQWDDPDVPQALEAARDGAAAAARRAASWPAYRAEVLGGRLDWGPAHSDGVNGGVGVGGFSLSSSSSSSSATSSTTSGGSECAAAAFWAANARRLEERDAEVLRTLVALLGAPSTDARTLAVACSDLARYVDASECPERARGLLSSLGANRLATALLAHSDGEVRRHALAAVQRVVLSRDKLQYLNNS